MSRAVTVDEVLWQGRSARFPEALSAGNFEATFQSPHPGVTTMWAGSLARWGIVWSRRREARPESNVDRLGRGRKTPATLLKKPRKSNPVHVVAINGIDYAEIHKVRKDDR